MTFFHKVLNSFRHPLHEEWIESFNHLQRGPEFPMNLALRSLEEIEENASEDERELQRCLLEDIIFNSISSYFFEDLIKSVGENADVAQELLEQFSERTEEMDEEIVRETIYHRTFIENERYCEGCPYCEKHKEFTHYSKAWINEDTDFFVHEYLKTKTLHFALEQILFDVLPHQKERLRSISSKNIDAFKHHVRNFVDQKLAKI